MNKEYVIAGKNYTIEELKKGVKNPYFDLFMTKTEVAVKKEDYATFEEVGKLHGVPAEFIMKGCLSEWAERLRNHE